MGFACALAEIDRVPRFRLMCGAWRAVGIGGLLVLAAACRPRSLDRSADGAGSVPAPSASGGTAPSGDGGGDGGGGVGTGSPSGPSCAALEPSPSLTALGTSPTRAPTATPFSCQPL